MAAALVGTFTAAEGAGALTTGSRTTTAGNFLTGHAGLYNFGGAPSTNTISDNKSNTFTAITQFGQTSGSDNTSIRVAHNAGGTRGTSHTISCTDSGSANTLTGHEWSGIATSPTVTSATGTGTSTSASASITPGAVSLVLGTMAYMGTATTFAETGGASLGVEVDENSDFQAFGTAYKTAQASGASTSIAWTLAASRLWLAVVIAVQEAAGTSTTIDAAPIETIDAAAGGMTAAVAISGAPSELKDGAAGSMTVAVAASGAIAELPDQVAGSMANAVAITGAPQELRDQLAASGGTPASNIDSAMTEARDQTAGAATVAVAVSGTLIELSDQASGGAVAAVSASAQLQELQDRLSAAVANAIGASSSLTEGNDSISAAGALSIAVTGSLQELANLMDSLAGQPVAIGSVSAQDKPDQVASSVQIAVAMSASMQEALDRLAASTLVATSITAAEIDLGDGIVSIVSTVRQASAQLTEDNLVLLADVAVAVAANFTGLERAEILEASSVIIVKEASGGFVAELLVPARVYPLKVDARRFVLTRDGFNFKLN